MFYQSYFRKKARVCKRKVDYSYKPMTDVFFNSNYAFGVKLYSYRCMMCGGIHLTSHDLNDWNSYPGKLWRPFTAGGYGAWK